MKDIINVLRISCFSRDDWTGEVFIHFNFIKISGFNFLFL